MSVDVAGPLLPLVPLLLGLIGLCLPPGDGDRTRRRLAAGIGTAGAAVALLLAFRLVLDPTQPPAGGDTGFTLAVIGDLEVRFGTFVDAAAAYVALAVTVVALCVQIYSITYLHDDPRYAPYAAQVGLFTGAMLLVVVSSDLILMLIGWEVMGACSYLLIGHDRRLPEAPAAAVKAFLVTRIGDIGFLLGIAVLVAASGSTRHGALGNHGQSAGTQSPAQRRKQGPV
ncbi:proton-conducting transporter transmembrane domain-containing protein, partial [Actinoplanes xinjiangensis]|uniref:proton-conducting transporter transmembrane domain-containing protein n=1 Tax=Actinoplanes xinjiangensis TaxID=512350 RepID=UPI00343D0BAC